MNEALCKLDNECYRVSDFANLPAIELSKKRFFLVCPKCEGRGYFKAAARNGRQSACFGARHEEGCSLSTVGSDGAIATAAANKDRVEELGSRIVLDLYFDDQATKLLDVQRESVKGSGAGYRELGSDTASDAEITRRPSSILNALCTSEKFSMSQQTFEIPSVGKYVVADFFVNFAALTHSHDAQYRGYWGRISDIGFTKGALWLNVFGPEIGYVSIFIPKDLVGAFQDRFPNINEGERGSFVLIFGTLQVAHAGKRYIRLEDLAFIAVQ